MKGNGGNGLSRHECVQERRLLIAERDITACRADGKKRSENVSRRVDGFVAELGRIYDLLMQINAKLDAMRGAK